MNARIVIVAVVLAAALIVLGTATWVVAASTQPTQLTGTDTNMRVPEPQGPLFDPLLRAPSGTNTDLVMYGTMWQPQEVKHFKYFRPVGWGTEARVKPIYAPGDEWVHIGLPHISVLTGSLRKVSLVEFCAKSSNGVSTRPFRLDVWAEEGKIETYTFTWPGDNNKHCISRAYTPVWKQSMGLSVWLHFANSTDVITLYKAWERVEP